MHRVVLRGACCALLCVSGMAAGCFGNRGVSCEDPTFYARSTTAPPIRVPEGLDVPDESQALPIPSGEPLQIPVEGEPPPCLEVPPEFFDESDRAPDTPE